MGISEKRRRPQLKIWREHQRLADGFEGTGEEDRLWVSVKNEAKEEPSKALSSRQGGLRD